MLPTFAAALVDWVSLLASEPRVLASASLTR